MRELQPRKYAQYHSIKPLIEDLKLKPVLDQRQWSEIIYLRSRRDIFSQELIISAVQKELVPRLEA